MSRLSTSLTPTPTTPTQAERATRYVAAKAHNAADARGLLEALGLIQPRRDTT